MTTEPHRGKQEAKPNQAARLVELARALPFKPWSTELHSRFTVIDDDVRRAVVCLLVACRHLGRDWRTDLPKRLAPFRNLLVSLPLAEIEAEVATITPAGDPTEQVVKFYESFLAAYDKKARDSGGVWETPDPIVSFMVRSVDELLKTRFGLKEGMLSQDVQILDPATGTGTFLRGILKHVGTAPGLGSRMHGVEISFCPWVLAVLFLGDEVDVKLGNALDHPDDAPTPAQVPRGATDSSPRLFQ